MTSAEEAVKVSWISGNGIFNPEKFEQEHFDELGAFPGGDDVNKPADRARQSTSTVRDSLDVHWKLATKNLGMTDKPKLALLEAWFSRLIMLHNQETRHYHTTVHLWEMIQYLDLLQSAKYTTLNGEDHDEIFVVILLSIFFHDAVYDGKSGTNEEDSAQLFVTFAEEMDVPPAIKTSVVDYIIATKKHQTDGESSSSLLALFLDLDMAVLGKQDTAYRQYAALIRQEYAFVPHSEYCSKRADVLETFLQQGRIFATPVMHQVLEQQARTNIRNEIESLRQGVIPGEL